MQKNCLVSVVMATFRRTEKFEKALKSIILQTYKNIEIIIVDDNADIIWNERVKQIIELCNDKRIIYIKNLENKGSAEARNVGIYKSTGVYITFLDDDDEYALAKIEKQLNFMLENNLNYSVTNMLLHDENEKLKQKRSRVGIEKSKHLLEYHLKNHITGTDTMMFEKKYLNKIGNFPPIDIGDEFYLMSNAILGKGKFGCLKEYLVKAVIHDGGVGLSMSCKKIDGEKTLYLYKKTFFKEIKYISRQHIKMRHYAVLSRYYYKNQRVLKAIFYIVISFFLNPIGFLNLIIKGE